MSSLYDDIVNVSVCACVCVYVCMFFSKWFDDYIRMCSKLGRPATLINNILMLEHLKKRSSQSWNMSVNRTSNFITLNR